MRRIIGMARMVSGGDAAAIPQVNASVHGQTGPLVLLDIR